MTGKYLLTRRAFTIIISRRYQYGSLLAQQHEWTWQNHAISNMILFTSKNFFQKSRHFNFFFDASFDKLGRGTQYIYSGKIFHKAVRRNYISGRMTFTGSKKNKSYWPRNKRTVFLYSRQFKFFMHYALRNMDRVPWTDLVFIPGNMYVLDSRTIASNSNDWLIHIFLSILKCQSLNFLLLVA